MELKAYTEEIIGAAIQVHRTLGCGFLESIYENALCEELAYLNIPFEKQLEVKILYRDKEVCIHRLDLLVHKEIVVELKACKELHDIHFSQTRSYLQSLGLAHGLLLNFGTKPLTIKRVINDNK